MRNNQSNCLSLTKRIHDQCFQEQRQIFLDHLGQIFIHLFILATLLMIFQCPNRLYNSWYGPFPMNLKQFREHVTTNHWAFKSILFQPEYLQVELGVGTIELKSVKSYSSYSDNPTQGILLDIFNDITEPMAYKNRMKVYARLPEMGNPYSRQRHAFHFQSFSIQTLRCILKQMNFSPKEFLNWPEKSNYVKKIEQIYDQSYRLYNENIVRKCGILLGYVFYPREKKIYRIDEHANPQKSEEKNVRVFDITWSYTSDLSHVFTAFSIISFVCHVLIISKNIVPVLTPPSNSMYSCMKTELMKLNGISLEDLNIRLLELSSEDSFDNRMFIVDRKYLVIFKISFDEMSSGILQEYYHQSLFNIIDIDSIVRVKSNSIVTCNNYIWSNISFSLSTEYHNQNSANWLESRLMTISNRYQELQELVSEETTYQIGLYRIKPASPYITAVYRLNSPVTISHHLMAEVCPICLDDFQIDQKCARWPCPGQHLFHFNCIIDALRQKHTCPLCRHPVEPFDSSSQ